MLKINLPTFLVLSDLNFLGHESIPVRMEIKKSTAFSASQGFCIDSNWYSYELLGSAGIYRSGTLTSTNRIIEIPDESLKLMSDYKYAIPTKHSEGMWTTHCLLLFMRKVQVLTAINRTEYSLEQFKAVMESPMFAQHKSTETENLICKPTRALLTLQQKLNELKQLLP